ncbi:ATP-binding protein [Kitasatospora sp. NPDC049285]|uniref:ATP-binding protein n=1 Tax=Kitasatospora sp. NPDC049285 TaxID=3157096 RepID=UPI0034191997
MPVSSTPQRLGTASEAHDPSGAAGRPGRDLPAAEHGIWTVSATFPPCPRNVALARRLATVSLAAWNASGLAEAAELVVSELVTNAIRYGRGAVSLDLTLDQDGLRIAVADYGPALPEAREAADGDAGGRGLAIVSALCDHWSVTTRLTGKTVECLLPPDGAGPAAEPDRPGAGQD